MSEARNAHGPEPGSVGSVAWWPEPPQEPTSRESRATVAGARMAGVRRLMVPSSMRQRIDLKNGLHPPAVQGGASASMRDVHFATVKRADKTSTIHAVTVYSRAFQAVSSFASASICLAIGAVSAGSPGGCRSPERIPFRRSSGSPFHHASVSRAVSSSGR